MSILDWFKNRPARLDSNGVSGETTRQCIEKAVTLTNPRLKLLRSYRERLEPAVETSMRYVCEAVASLPAPVRVSASQWSSTPELRAFFANARDIADVLSRSHNLHTFFNKYPLLGTAHLVLGMAYEEQRIFGMSMRGDVVQRDVAQTVVGFSDHKARICGETDAEVRRLLGTQLYEYLLAQALSEIGEERSERQEFEDNRALIRARLRLLQQQGSGLGTVFGSAPDRVEEQLKLENQLLENERQIESLGSFESALNQELDCLCAVLEAPECYIRVENRKLRLNTMNVVFEESAVTENTTGQVSKIEFSLVRLLGAPTMERAFVLATFDRVEMREIRMNFDRAGNCL